MVCSVLIKEFGLDLVTPLGFRDILPEEAREREAIARNVAALFDARGYRPIETPTLEVLDVMQMGAKSVLSPFKFFDSRGDLLAMRPDVTVQIARMVATRFSQVKGPLKLRYQQRVFRETEAQMQATAREQTQVGLELIGESGPAADAEVIGLFCEALALAGVENYTLGLATVGVLRALLERSGAPQAWRSCVLAAFHTSNFVELDRLTDTENPPADVDACGLAPVFAQAIRQLPVIRGGLEAIDELRAIVGPLGCSADLDDFETTCRALADLPGNPRLLVDFSLIGSLDYYTGVLFNAYSPHLGSSIGGGGRYDSMMAAFGSNRPAAGFAFALESAMAAASVPAGEGAATASDVPARPLRIAVPKGALHKDAVAVLAAAGLDVTGLDNPGRQLIISNPGVDYIIVRPSDAPAFVALGAADCGICGKDSLLEASADVVELQDLHFGACRFVVAMPSGSRAAADERYRRLGSIRVATKYPRITTAHFAKTGMQVEIVQLHGNIELAPLTAMAECIVDITATGATLRENNLEITEEVLGSTARFFANPAALRTDERLGRLAEALANATAGMSFEAIAGQPQ